MVRTSVSIKKKDMVELVVSKRDSEASSVDVAKYFATKEKKKYED